MCDQLIPTYWFAEHLKQHCTNNSKRLLWMPVDGKEGLREITSSREGTVSVDRRRNTLSPQHPRRVD